MKKKRTQKKKNTASNRWIEGILFAIFIIVFIGTAFLIYRKRYSYRPIPPEILAAYPVKGIDISRHNGLIDWSVVREQGYTFAFIKATESINYTDPSFQSNYERASDEGLIVGAYHFFRFNEDGKKQAAHFISNNCYNKGDLPPVVDVEHSPFNFASNPKEVSKRLGELLTSLQLHYGTSPIIYTNKECYLKYIRPFFPHVRLWICDLSGEPDPEVHSSWIFWQYSHRGEVMGINEKVDLNVFNGSIEELLSLTHH